MSRRVPAPVPTHVPCARRPTFGAGTDKASAALRAAFPLLALLVLLVPSVSAANASVTLWEEDGRWNGLSAVDGLAAPAGDAQRALVWVPAGARVHSVVASGPGGAGEASWSAAGEDALRLRGPPETTSFVVEFDFRGGAPNLARYVAPMDLDALTLDVRPEDERVPQAPGFAFRQEDPREGDAPAWRAERGAVAQGESIPLRVVDADRIGELPLLASVGGLSLLVLLGTLAYHRVRPPLGGKAPERFLDHLAELQARLLPPGVLFALLNVFYFAMGLRVASWRGVELLAPTFGVDGSIATRAFDAFAERLVPEGVSLVVLRPVDAVLAQVGVSLFLALVTVLPLLVYELAVFIGPALMPREQRALLRTLPVVTLLFLAGALAGYLLMAPLMIRTLYGYAPALGADALLGVGDLVAFALLVVLSFAFAFELPVAMYALSRLGIVKAGTFGKYLRHAIVVIVVAAGILTPDPSVISQLLVAVPITLLYVVGIVAATLGERARPAGAP